MATKELKARVKHAYLSAAEWVNKNPILQEGELGIESDTRFAKYGDGKTSWKNLEYSLAKVSIPTVTVEEMKAMFTVK